MMPARLERCVKHLMADPDFKPKNPKQSKESAAYAACTAMMKKTARKRLVRRKLKRRKRGS